MILRMLTLHPLALWMAVLTAGSVSASAWLQQPMKPSARGTGASFTLQHPPRGVSLAAFWCDPELGLSPVLRLGPYQGNNQSGRPGTLMYTNGMNHGVLAASVDTIGSEVLVYLDHDSISEYIRAAVEGDTLELRVSIYGISNTLEFTMPTAGLFKQMLQNPVCRVQLAHVPGVNVPPTQSLPARPASSMPGTWKGEEVRTPFGTISTTVDPNTRKVLWMSLKVSVGSAQINLAAAAFARGFGNFDLKGFDLSKCSKQESYQSLMMARSRTARLECQNREDEIEFFLSGPKS